MLVVGTRGDVQPFLAIAERLQEFGHHVRLATHANFSSFVRSAGVDFYPLGGDPRVLAGYMARNKGFIPSAPGEISTQRKQLKAIIESLLAACTEPDMETGMPFKAQAIIANPPAYGHVHVAEALRIPIHIFFTMPWTFSTQGYAFSLPSSIGRPTYEFPHPLARVPQSAGFWPLEDPKNTMDIILEALKDTGQRGIVDQGWEILEIVMEVPDSVFLLKDCPHDWLFPQCAAVVHHGGAGTTAMGLRAGCPDNYSAILWRSVLLGDRVHKKGLGPAPIPIARLSAESLSNAIRFMREPELKR
ncbi:sterol 3-beta-glucosyltransferase UGT80B1-like isoform X3 [Populus alba x Populus x berolinensis]|uniref:Sterol 3-beta-glucosyltransferase UGT80B1-like isoform X3 n=1 Tax=Populus alba x Populus x berolinensis TaxID=444605 RepID=A0AAD6W3U6_9ROSI|nr:sterol 3-beta-glucosyltransferase UGT80B1-like isoform X3 [Populus alba x Populus x berolinensis]